MYNRTTAIAAATNLTRRPTTCHHGGSTHAFVLAALPPPHRRPLRFEPLEDRCLLATFTVDSVLDVINLEDNFLTLREAIQLANVNPGSDAIAFAPALTESGPATILLTMGELAISDSISIDGPGADRLAIDAQLQSRIFNITATTGDFMISGLGLCYGQTTGDNADSSDTTYSGGAIRSLTTGNLALRDVNIENNGTTGLRALGGGIFASGPLSLTSSRVNGNATIGESGDGGGVFVNSSITIVGSTLSQNRTDGNSASGGAISTVGSLTATDSIISENRTAGNMSHGGGMQVQGEVKLIRTTIANNQTSGGGALGGGILVISHGLTLTDSHLTANRTTGSQSSGGGARASGSIMLINSTATRNSTGGVASDGGGLHSALGDITLIGSRVAANATRAPQSPGGGLNAQRVFLIDSVVEQNLTFATASSGGGIFANTLEATRSAIRFNLTRNSDGGGAFIGAQATLIASIVHGNSIDGFAADGGGLRVGGILSLTQTTVSENSSMQSVGGGISAFGDVFVVQSTISGNTAFGSGGGIAVVGTRSLSVRDSTISGNSTTKHGGGIYHAPTPTVAGSTTIERSTIADNSATGPASTGGGLAIIGHPTAIRGAIVVGNSAGNNPDLSWNGPTSLVLEHSLVGDGAGTALVEAPVGSPDANGNLVGGPVNGVIDPLMGPLAANGGPTFTHALLPGSPALDAGDPNAVAGMDGVPEFDQRGMPWSRVANGDDVPEARIDMGAFEWQPNPLAGDYSFDGVVDTADVVVWRKTLGSTTDLRADGDGDGNVDADDYDVWAANFGNALAFPIGTALSATRRPPALPGVTSAVEFASLDVVAADEPPADFGEVSRTEPGAVGVSADTSLNRMDRRAVGSRPLESAASSTVEAQRDDALLAWLRADDERRFAHVVDDVDNAEKLPRNDADKSIADALAEALAGWDEGLK